jgi:hypothetical protein
MGDKISHQATVMGIALLVVLAVVPITDAQVGQYFVWEAIIQGEVQGQRFQRQAFVYLTTPLSSAGTMNGANPFEVAIISGNPPVTPEPGAIWFSTNSALRGGTAALDLAYVSYDPTQALILLQPDPNLSATGLNVFTAFPGVTADIYQIFGGSIYLWSQDGFATILSQINILGTGAIFHSNTPYVAFLSGRFIGSGSF